MSIERRLLPIRRHALKSEAETISGQWTFSSGLRLANNQYLQALESGGTARNLLGLDSGNEIQLGNTNNNIDVTASTQVLSVVNSQTVSRLRQGEVTALEVADNANVLSHVRLFRGIVAVTGTTYTFVQRDATRLVEKQGASNLVITIPTNASVELPIGTKIVLTRISTTGSIDVGPASGVQLRYRVGGVAGTLVGTGTIALSLQQYGRWILHKRNTDDWYLYETTA